MKPVQLLIKRRGTRAAIGLIALFFILGLSYFFFIVQSDCPSLDVKQTTTLYTSQGHILGKHTYGQNRDWVALSDISPHIIAGTIATEDQNFYRHHGFDFKRIAAALMVDIAHFSKVQGASTITQQYARNLYLSHEKTWTRKIKEAYYTMRLEAHYDKNQLLEGYLNTIYYGHGMYGVEAASQYYFGKHAKDLDLTEAGYLVGIPKGPNLYTPIGNLAEANRRKKVVLQSMYDLNFINQAQYKEALSTQYERTASSAEMPSNDFAPYFQDMVMKEAAEILHTDVAKLSQYGLTIYTTLDEEIQRTIENSSMRLIPDQSEIQLAVMSMDPKTGEVKGIVGGRDYAKSPFNRATQAYRQPGSTMKPILYYTALENGFTPATTMKSAYTSFVIDHEKEVYQPGNYNHAYANDFITMALAMAVSDNIYAVKTHLFLGMNALVDSARKMGIHSKLDAVPSLALGSSPTSMSEMMNAYALLANGGKSVKPTYIRTIVDRNGKLLYTNQVHQKSKQILNADHAFLTTHMMTGMFDSSLNSYMRVTGDSIAKSLTRPYAGKSGSTNVDGWMIGYTPSLLTGVWVGYDRDHLLEKPYEKLLARNIWVQVMEESLQNKPIESFTPTKGVEGALIDPITGQLATENCPQKRFVYFKKGDIPTKSCTEHPVEEKQEKQKEKEPSWFAPFKKWSPF